MTGRQAAHRERQEGRDATEQLQFDIECACALLSDHLKDHRRTPNSGAERLLKTLVQRGLSKDALPAAAGLALELDRVSERNPAP